MTGAVGTPELTGVPAADWLEARRRHCAIRALAETAERTRAHAEATAAMLGFDVSFVYKLLVRYQADPRVTSMLPGRRGRRDGDLVLAAEVDEVIQAAINEVFLTRQRPRVSDLVIEIRRRCWTLGLPRPSRKAIQKRIDQRATSEVLAKRAGRKAARDRFAPAIGSLDAPWPLALVQIDHTLVDVIAVDSTTRQPIQRPWLTLAIDVHSRCVAGFHLALEPPSATSVALCLAQAALPKAGWLMAREVPGEWPVEGVPERLHLDNAKEFHSEALKRGCEQYGIAVDYRPVRTPHYGSHIERLIGTMMGKVHLLPGTTFSDVRAKGEWNAESTAAMTLDEIERWLAHAIVGVYHRDLHRGIGTTPLAAWERGLVGDEEHPGRGASVTVADPRRFLIDFLPIERRLVRREGVFLHSIGYWSDVLRTWVGERERMPERFGRQRFTAARPSQQTRRIGVCPECLAEDDIPYIRRDWTIGWVGACAWHRAILVRACPECGAKLRLPSLGSGAHFAPERCTRCAFQLGRAPYWLAPAPMVQLQERLLNDRPSGSIKLPGMGAFDWSVAVVLFDALLGIVWFDTKPTARDQFFARTERDFDCEPFGDASDGADGLSILAWLLDAWPSHTQLAFAVLRASRPRRQMRRWPHLDPDVRAEVEAVLLGAWPDQKHGPDRGWWRPWIETLPETGDDLRAMAKCERLPHRRQRLMALADVRDGLPVEVAAEAAAVMARTLYNWLRRGAKGGLATALERPRWQYLTEPQARELIEWIGTASPHSRRWRSDRVVNEAQRRFGVEITMHVAQAMLRRHGPWPRRIRRPKRRLTVAPVYD